jgi:hypothetical protein
MDLLLKSEVVSTARTRNICGFATSMAPRPNQVARADAILKTQGTRKAPLGIERHFNDFASPNKSLRLLTRSRPSECTSEIVQVGLTRPLPGRSGALSANGAARRQGVRNRLRRFCNAVRAASIDAGLGRSLLAVKCVRFHRWRPIRICRSKR